jgi:outer membrane biosynthesis protein TonB
MFSSIFGVLKVQIAQLRERHGAALELSPAFLGSLLLHGLALFLILFLILRHRSQIAQKSSPYVPVDVVQMGDETTTPPAPNHAPVPQQKAMRGPAAAPKPEGYAPNRAKAPKDELEVQLRNLSRLSQPNSDLKIENGASDDAATSNGADPGAATAYSVRDYIRAQILRRWVFDFSTLGNRNLSIPLRVSLTGRGVVIVAEIMDHHRYVTDKVYRDVALSARNAVLLSAPFKLPDGAPREGVDFTLDLNPRDTLR